MELAINFLRREEEQVGLTIKRRLAFSEMDSRGLTSLEEGGGKKSQWSLWEQADKISGSYQKNYANGGYMKPW